MSTREYYCEVCDITQVGTSICGGCSRVMSQVACAPKKKPRKKKEEVDVMEFRMTGVKTGTCLRCRGSVYAEVRLNANSDWLPWCAVCFERFLKEPIKKEDKFCETGKEFIKLVEKEYGNMRVAATYSELLDGIKLCLEKLGRYLVNREKIKLYRQLVSIVALAYRLYEKYDKEFKDE
jgi:hypothetical protein